MRLGKKNQRVTKEEFRPVLLAVMIVLLISILIFTEMEESKEPQRLYGIPVRSVEFGEESFSSVAQIIEVGEHLYILPINSNGFIQVYDLDGQYQYSLFFHESTNGGFAMASEGDTFYVQDQSGGVYRFLNGEFQEYVERKIAKVRFGHIEFVWQGSTPGYEFRGRDLWRVSDGEEVLLIPDLVNFGADTAVACVALVLLLGVLWLIANYLKRRRTAH